MWSRLSGRSKSKQAPVGPAQHPAGRALHTVAVCQGDPALQAGRWAGSSPMPIPSAGSSFSTELRSRWGGGRWRGFGGQRWPWLHCTSINSINA